MSAHLPAEALTAVHCPAYMADMATRRTTVVLSSSDEKGLRLASKREGVSQSELIRRGIKTVIAPYVARKRRPRLGWLHLDTETLRAVWADTFSDPDA
jgi:hypothetical protein